MSKHLIPKACLGYPNGHLCTPEEFLRRVGNDYKTKHIFPFCPECDERLILVNPSNILKSTFYKHYDLDGAIDAESIEICSLRSKKSVRQGWFCSDFDFERGKSIREAFLEQDNLCAAYCFCWSLCGKGNLSFEQFRQMLHLADKKKIWSYANIELWMIPYMLLTLCNFQHHKGFVFHFILHKQYKNQLNFTDIFSSGTEIQKVFTESHRLMAKSPNNPLSITKENYLNLVKNSFFYNNQDFSAKLFQYIVG
ncbi:hypothetical protein ACFGWM_03430 [Pasteurella multocida]